MSKLAFNHLVQFLDGNGAPYSGAKLFTYEAGTSTKEPTYQDSGSSTAHANPIVCDANGRIPAAIWLTDQQNYKFVLATSADTDPPASPIWTLDNVAGINDPSVLDQWKASGLTPTYVSSASFTLVGDQTSAFHVGRRLKITDGGGTKYCHITASAFTTLTTVTVAGASLATPVTAVSYGLLTATNPSLPVKGENGTVLMADSAHADGARWAPAAFTFKNRLINPDGAIYQRAVAATADDVYFADRWYMLTQTGTVTPSVLTDPEDGFPKGVRITQAQAAAQRFGFAQIIEGKNCKDLRGQSGVMVPRVRISASQAIRYAILAWTGTEDAVTSDVVNDWTSADYTDGAAKFFVDANITPLVVGAQTPSANVWTSLAAITAALGSTFNNLIVLVWTEGTAAQNVTLDFDYVQLERGSVATEFERRAIQIEQELCARYCQSTQFGFFGETTNTFSFGGFYQFATVMRANPTVGTQTDAGSVSFPTSAATIGIESPTGFRHILAANVTGANGTYIRTALATAEL